MPAKRITIIVLSMAAGCSTPALPVIVSAEPAGAGLRVDDRDVGAAPVTVDFKDGKARRIDATLAGYHDATVTLTKDDAGVRAGLVKLTLTPDAAWAATTMPADAANGWVPINVDPALWQDRPDAAWERLVAIVTDRYVQLDVLGEIPYLMSKPITRHFSHPTRGGVTVRSRVAAGVASPRPLLTYKVNLIAEEAYDDTPGVWTASARVLKEDAEMMTQLRRELGVKTDARR